MLSRLHSPESSSPSRHTSSLFQPHFPFPSKVQLQPSKHLHSPTSCPKSHSSSAFSQSDQYLSKKRSPSKLATKSVNSGARLKRWLESSSKINGTNRRRGGNRLIGMRRRRGKREFERGKG